MKKLSSELKKTTEKLAHVESALKDMIRKQGVRFDASLHKDLAAIMAEHTAQDTPNDFVQMFWKEQVKAFSLKRKSSMR